MIPVGDFRSPSFGGSCVSVDAMAYCVGARARVSNWLFCVVLSLIRLLCVLRIDSVTKFSQHSTMHSKRTYSPSCLFRFLRGSSL